MDFGFVYNISQLLIRLVFYYIDIMAITILVTNMSI